MARTKKSYIGKNNPNWKNARKPCILCGKKLNSYNKSAKYHRKCYFKIDKSNELKKRISRSLKGKYTGSQNSQWKGGFYISKRGYKYIRKPDHPFALKNGYIAEHRLVLEKKLGRYLLSKEITHHINHNKLDNRQENLIILSSQSKHRSLHAKGNKNMLGKKHTSETKRKMSKVRFLFWRKKKGLD